MLHEVWELEDPVQSGPLFIGPTFDLERVLFPEPHVFEHESQGCHVLQVQATQSNSDIS